MKATEHAVQCAGVASILHRLGSSVLAGRDNYTAAWKTLCTETGGSYATYLATQTGKQRNQKDNEQ